MQESIITRPNFDVLENLPSFIEEVYYKKCVHSGIGHLTPSELEKGIAIDPASLISVLSNVLF